LMKKAKK